MRTTYITATIIAILLAAWLASGMLGGEETAKPDTLANQNREQSRVDEDTSPTKVRVTVMQASPQERMIKVRGKTENKRTVDVKVELSGTIVKRPVDRGSLVARGDLLCELSIEDRQAALTESQAALAQAQIEYTGALSLKGKRL